MTFWLRLRSMLGATLAGFGWRPQGTYGRAYAVLIRREPWWRRVWHVFRPEPPTPPVAYAGPPPWTQAPESELGVAVPLREVLASDSDVVIGLIDCVAYSTGFEFSIALRSKHGIDAREMGFGPPPPHGPDRSDNELTFGIEFADGRKAVTGGHPSPELMAQWKVHAEGGQPSPSDGPLLMPRGGGGGGKRYDFTYWVWPLPPEGTLTFLCEWKARGLGPTAHEVDATAIRRAGTSSKSIWTDG
jgi:hypothetical protein